MGYRPHAKQVAAHRAFMLDGYKRGILLMGRQCLVGNTLVATPDGYTHIKDLQVGDEVLSSDGYKKIINTWQYGVDIDPKPMLQFKIDEETITCTYDHKFYYNGDYVPLYFLAWGAMATSERSQLKLLCEQYGSPFDYDQAQQKGLDLSDEASFRCFGVSENGFRWQDSESPSGSSPDLVTESVEQTRSKSYKQQEKRQSDSELGVGNTSREHSAHTQDGTSSQQAGRELRNTQTKRATSYRDTSFKRENALPSDSREIRGIVLHDPRHYFTENLGSSVTVHSTVDTYAIDVEDTHDYCITTKNILVGNSGKTFFAVNHGWISAMKEQGRYFVVFKTYKQAHEVVWRQYIPLIPKELIYKTNEQDLLVEFNYVDKGEITLPDGSVVQVEHDKSKPRSTLQLLGSDQADSHRGFRAHGIIFDEYGDQDPNNFDTVYEPMFTTTNGWAIFMGTPRGYNHFYEMIELRKEDPTWFYQTATWRDSPYVSAEHMATARRDAEMKGALSSFMQEYELEFRSVQGAVYPMLDRKIHLKKPDEIPEDLTYYLTIDFGWHTTACLIVGVDQDQTWYVVDEIYGRKEELDHLIPRFKAKTAGMRIVLAVGDSANRDAIEVMSRHYPMVGVNKANDQKGYALGIGQITEKLRPRQQLVGLPKPSLFISSVCKNFIKEMETYRFPEEKAERNPSDVPIKEDDHGPDALRYLFLHLKFGIVTDTKVPTPTAIKDQNEYGI